MTLPSEPGPAKAARHYRRAGEYYELAQGFLARASGDAGAADILVAAGGALLYEAAKQCVNAVANLNGRGIRRGTTKRWRRCALSRMPIRLIPV